jgi:hypothetical protein
MPLLPLLLPPLSLPLALDRLMSDYEVTLVDGKMSEFFVKFHGPEESTSKPLLNIIPHGPLTRSTIR